MSKTPAEFLAERLTELQEDTWAAYDIGEHGPYRLLLDVISSQRAVLAEEKRWRKCAQLRATNPVGYGRWYALASTIKHLCVPFAAHPECPLEARDAG